MTGWEDDLVDRIAGGERDARMAAAVERNARIAEEDARRAAEVKRSNDENSRVANARALLREYAAAGVRPPRVDADGVPTVSLSMLRMMGWTVESFGGEGVLVRPGGDR